MKIHQITVSIADFEAMSAAGMPPDWCDKAHHYKVGDLLVFSTRKADREHTLIVREVSAPNGGYVNYILDQYPVSVYQK